MNRLTAGMVGLVAVAVIGAGFFAVVQGRAADVCAEKLVAAIAAHDRGFLAARLDNPLLLEHLLAARSAELVFTRPRSTEWIRVGVSVTGTAAPALTVLLLETSSLPECRFVGDYERGKGAFVPPG